jgi:hypothetical protein
LSSATVLARSAPQRVRARLQALRAKGDLIDANLALRLRTESLARRTCAVRSWRRLSLPQMLLGIPIRDSKHFLALAGDEHHGPFESFPLPQVRQDAIAEERDVKGALTRFAVRDTRVGRRVGGPSC